VGTNGVVEEPISSELVLVDGALARRARAALPEPPWLLPVLAELEESARATPPPPVAAETPPPSTAEPAPAAPVARPRRRLGAASGVSVALALAAVAVLSLAFLPLSRGPRVTTTPLRQAAPATPVRPPAAARPKRSAPTHTVTRARPKPKVARAKKPAAAAKRPRPRPTRRAAPPPRPLPRTQRVFSWRRYPSAVFYELHLQRGAETLYETRTLTPRAVLPAGLRLRPGTYHVFVRPAVPGDAGIMLGPAIMRRTIRA
jgi:hypothetical protein